MFFSIPLFTIKKKSIAFFKHENTKNVKLFQECEHELRKLLKNFVCFLSLRENPLLSVKKFTDQTKQPPKKGTFQ